MDRRKIRFAFINGPYGPHARMDSSYHFGQLSLASAIANDAELAKIADAEVKLFDANWLGPEQLLGKIASFQPDFIGLTVCDSRLEEIKRLLNRLSSALGNSRVILGGPMATFDPIEALSSLDAQILLRGECEKTLPLFLRIAANPESDAKAFDSVPGLFMKNCNGKILKFGRSGEIPRLSAEELDRHYVDWSMIVRAEADNGVKYPSIRFVSSRGCPRACTFCLRPLGSVFRAMSPEKITAEITNALKVFPRNVLLFDDDCFTYDAKRALELSKKFLETGLSRKLKTTIVTDVDSFFNESRQMRFELIDALNEMGVEEVLLGVENLSLDEIKRMRKGNYAPEEVISLCREFSKRKGAFVRIMQILSNIDTAPSNLLEHLLNSILLIKTCKNRCGVCIGPYTVAFKHTAVYSELEKRGLQGCIAEKMFVMPRDPLVRKTLLDVDGEIEKEEVFDSEPWSTTDPGVWKKNGLRILVKYLSTLLKNSANERELLEANTARNAANEKRLSELAALEKKFGAFKQSQPWIFGLLRDATGSPNKRELP